jgi:enediyne biosynthesis protein E5
VTAIEDHRRAPSLLQKIGQAPADLQQKYLELKAKGNQDTRYKALRNFAISMSIFNIFGYTLLGFEQMWILPILAVITGYTTDLALETVTAWSRRRRPQYLGRGPRGMYEFLLPAHITSLAVNMLIYTNDQIRPVLFGVMVGVSGKYLLQAPIAGRMRHFMNPSNLGIVATFVCFSRWITVVQPYEFTENTNEFFKIMVPVIILTAGTVLNAKLTGRTLLIVGWLGGFAIQAFVRHAIWDVSVFSALGVMTGVAFVLFTNYMITDPGTTPSKPLPQFTFGVGVAFIYAVMMEANIVNTLFFSVLVVCGIRGSGWWAVYLYDKFHARGRERLGSPIQVPAPVDHEQAKAALDDEHDTGRAARCPRPVRHGRDRDLGGPRDTPRDDSQLLHLGVAGPAVDLDLRQPPVRRPSGGCRQRIVHGLGVVRGSRARGQVLRRSRQAARRGRIRRCRLVARAVHRHPGAARGARLAGMRARDRLRGRQPLDLPRIGDRQRQRTGRGRPAVLRRRLPSAGARRRAEGGLVTTALRRPPSAVIPRPRFRMTPALVGKLGRDRLARLPDVAREFDDAARFRIGSKTLYFFNHPDHAKHVLADNAGNYHGGFGLTGARRVPGDGLLTSEGERWRQQRRAVQSAFRPERMAGLTGVVVDETETMLRRLDAAHIGRGPLDMAAEMTRLTLRVLGRAVLVAAMVARRFRLRAVGDCAVQPEASLSLRVRGGLPMSAERA